MIKVGFLVSYDFKYLYKSIPLVYNDADLIVLAVDKDRLTWSGNPLYIDPLFFEWVAKFDTLKKIVIYEDSFFVPENTPSENDTRERNLLAKAMGEGGWHIQIDSDEYFNDFKSFTVFLKEKSHFLKNPEKHPVEIHVQWITLFKKVDDGFLYIKDSLDAVEVATNYPKYKYMRATRHSKKIITKFILLHQSWARDDDEIYTKITNWSHRDDSDNIAFFEFWKNINLNNYKEFANFHENDPTKWKSLEFVSENEIDSLKIKITDFQLFKLKIKKYLVQFIRENMPASVQEKIKTIFKRLVK
ncbi:hypothetical protein [Flavobacterium phragmitis]|uniref:Glycosyl transferase family 2 n=1 Tax=Flavobacterium phragmitis TaxID=739143 RepID=A0A1I1KEL5_9FLAO|nr:hypothetical protein [Flavobacterium phragmitis]SFC55920.1 hypothetical protein SAMN05216297_101251 [Flavobacterium phragmitis]